MSRQLRKRTRVSYAQSEDDDDETLAQFIVDDSDAEDSDALKRKVKQMHHFHHDVRLTRLSEEVQQKEGPNSTECCTKESKKEG
jgi:hypothetical protein